MTPIEIFAGLASGSAIYAVKILADIRNDASTALRLLTGEEAVEDDSGLVAEVSQLKDRIQRVERIVLNQSADETTNE